MEDLHRIFGLYIGQKAIITKTDVPWEIADNFAKVNDIVIVDFTLLMMVTQGNMEAKLILKPIDINNLPNVDMEDGGIDEWRELGYDCGYKDTPKLLDTEYAVTMEEAEKLTNK